MLINGLVHGIGQINNMNLLLKDERVEAAQKELATSIISIVDDLAIFIASIIGIILDHTIFQKENQ